MIQKLVSLQQNKHKLCPKFCADASADHKHLTGKTFINVMTWGGNGCFHGVFRCRCCKKTDASSEKASAHDRRKRREAKVSGSCM